MAIKVGGTEVVDNNRQLKNIASVDATTVAALGTAGVGGGGGAVDFTASGSLSNGDLVKLNSNGTVSVVAGGGAGSEFTFNSGNSSENTATFDSNSNKIVIVYKDGGNSNYGTAVVGTVSGSSISFGSEVVFHSGGVDQLGCTFDSNLNKVVIFYLDTSAYHGKAVVGTVSGTSISFGTPVVFKNNYSYISKNCATFDSNSNKVVLVFGDNISNQGYATALVGTVSGTSISFGSATVFTSHNVTTQYGVTFDSNSNKVVVAYKGSPNNNYDGTAVVGTVSGTSISFGSAVVFNSGQTNYSRCTFDSNSNKVVIAYEDYDNGQIGEAVVGTVSGTSISFGTPVAFQDTGGKIGGFISLVFDSDSNQIIIVYQDNTNSPSILSIVVGSVNGTSLNFKPFSVLDTLGHEQVGMTFDSNANRAVVLWSKQSNMYGTAATFKPTDVSEWIGFASAAVSNGATATINVVSSINEGQSGLTVGSKYYLPDSGTLTTTAISGREVGFATAATKLLITQGSVS
tara:strand:- start:1425 stop:2966 length:1542 start_codon:yes stop_codon:yes gene_type:complete